MNELPILFRPEMVAAIKRVVPMAPKTMTRRAIQLPHGWAGDALESATRWEYENGLFYPCSKLSLRERGIACPYGCIGDRLWIKEKHAYIDVDTHTAGYVRVEIRYSDSSTNALIIQTDDPPKQTKHGQWRPSIFMHRWASRLLLEIVDVRVERLNDISDGDVMAEGVVISPVDGRFDCSGRYVIPYKYYFRGLWDSINGEDSDISWTANPWVWVIVFKVVKS